MVFHGFVKSMILCSDFYSNVLSPGHVTDSRYETHPLLSKKKVANMCKAIRDGGNRCPKHRHDSIALVQLASELSGMTRSQTEDMLVQLRREGRNPELVSQEEWNAAMTKIDEAIEASDSPNKEALKARMVKAREHGRLPSRATVYAMERLVERSKVRGQNLQNRLREIAESSGYTLGEVKEKYAAEYAAVDRSRGAAVPPEYNQSSVRYAKLANLPQDRSTVTALARVQASVSQGPRRVTRAPLPFASSFIHEAGYDDGRLEVTFQANPDTVYAYRDVPASVWERMQAGSAGSIYAREVRGNGDYQYSTAEEAEQDAYKVRCSSCGQFAARTGHTCPTREEREQMEATTGASTASYDERVESNPALVAESEVTEEDDVAENTDSEAIAAAFLAAVQAPAEEAPYSDPDTVEDADISEEEEAIATPQTEPVAEEPVVEEEPEMLPDRDGLLTVTGPVRIFPDHVVTAENQRHPQVVQMPEHAVIEKNVDMSYVMTVRGKCAEYYFTANRYPTSRLSESDMNRIRLAPEDVMFVVGSKLAHTGTATIIDIYDSKHYHAQVHSRGYDNFDDNGDPVTNPSSYVLTRIPPQPEFIAQTREEWETARDEANTELNTLVTNGDAVLVERNSSVTRKFTFDASLPEAARVSFAKATDFRRGIKDGKTVVTDVMVRLPYCYKSYDDQGEYAGTRSITISGRMAFKRNENGVMEVVSDARTLRCGCREYRMKYKCHHLDYMLRHAGNLAQQTMPAERSHRLLTTALSGRADVSVVEPEGGTPFIRFDAEQITRCRNSWYPHYNTNVPAHLRPADWYEPTNDEIRRMQEFNSMSGNLYSISAPASPAQVRSAIRRAPVELPVSAAFNNYNGQNQRRGQVTGHFMLKQGEDGNVEVSGRSLKCTCAEYQENYDCEHVRFLKDQHEMFLNMNSRSYRADTRVNQFYHDNFERWREVEQISSYMRRHGITEEEATARIEQERLAEEERRRLYQERMERENAAYYERERQREAERAVARAAELAALAERQAGLVKDFEEYRKERLKAWEEVETPYTENPEAFQNAVEEALKRKKNGEDAVPFMTENVTDGICGNGPGTRAFGIELEFDIKRGVDKRAALRKIGQELHEAGLTPGPNQVGYHSAAANGYAQWSFENDCTVDAELVSPIMKDTPEHWEQLRKVIEIVERNGGVASSRAGSHVHVSSGSYQTKVAPHAELLRTFNKHEDVMYRLASDPKRGKHRGVRWCTPNANDREEDISKDDARNINILGQHAHALGLNFESANNNDWKKANVEFRLWDSTLNAGVIQQQVALSVAMTDYAEREVEKNGAAKKAEGGRKTIGHGRTNEKRILDAKGVTKHNEETFKEANADAASFFDSMFRTKKHRDAAASLFAVTNWQQRSN